MDDLKKMQVIATISFLTIAREQRRQATIVLYYSLSITASVEEAKENIKNTFTCIDIIFIYLCNRI